MSPVNNEAKLLFDDNENKIWEEQKYFLKN